MEKACWAAGRWAETYLLAEQPISTSLEQALGKQGKGVAIAQKLTSIAVSLLFGEAWLGEVDLHRIVILKLLGMMGRRRLMREAMLHSSDWQWLLGEPAHLMLSTCPAIVNPHSQSSTGSPSISKSQRMPKRLVPSICSAGYSMHRSALILILLDLF